MLVHGTQQKEMSYGRTSRGFLSTAQSQQKHEIWEFEVFLKEQVEEHAMVSPNAKIFLKCLVTENQ